MNLLGFSIATRIIRNQKGKVEKANKSVFKDLMFLSALVVELSELIATGFIYVFKVFKYFIKAFKSVIQKRMVYLKVNIYGISMKLTIIDQKKYKSYKAYEYYPNLLRKTPKEVIS